MSPQYGRDSVAPPLHLDARRRRRSRRAGRPRGGARAVRGAPALGQGLPRGAAAIAPRYERLADFAPWPSGWTRAAPSATTGWSTPSSSTDRLRRGDSPSGPGRTLDGVSVAPAPTVTLGDRFAGELPELALPWRAAEVPDPRLLVLNEPLATELGLDPDCAAQPRRACGCWSATRVPDGATPVAQAYAGHQFGGYSPRLGDGRALLLGELVDADGRLRDLHLKGSGRTPFARGGDGLAAVGPMLREYVVSEAMHALGIPTTRSLAVVATGPPGAPRDPAAGSGARPGREQPPAGGQLPVRPRPPATSTCCAGWPTTRSPATTPTPRRPSTPTSRCSRRWSPPRRRWWPGGCSWGSSTG